MWLLPGGAGLASERLQGERGAGGPDAECAERRGRVVE
jgi:hypothetical protein